MNMNPMKVAVIFDASAPVCYAIEESVSEAAPVSAVEIAVSALKEAGCDAALLPLRGCARSLGRRLAAARADVVVNLCESFSGYSALEPHVAAALELLQIPFTGNSAESLALCRNKFKTKAILNSCGLPTPRGWQAETEKHVPRRAAFPLFVKPVHEDASIGIGPEAVVRDRQSLAERIAWIRNRYDQPALVEEFAGGREFNVALVGDASEARPLPVSEIEFRGFAEGEYRFVDYRAKWIPSAREYGRTPPVCPADISRALAARLQSLAVRAWAAAGLRGYARVDFRLNSAGRPLILEVNPNPDVSLGSGFARALGAAGMSYADFWSEQAVFAARCAALARKAHGLRAKTEKTKQIKVSLPDNRLPGKLEQKPEEPQYHANMATIA